MGHPHMPTQVILGIRFGSPCPQISIHSLTLIIQGAYRPTSLLRYGYPGTNMFLYHLGLLISILKTSPRDNGCTRGVEVSRILLHLPLAFAVGMLSLVSSLTDYRPVLLKFGETLRRILRQYRAKGATLCVKV